MCLISIECYHCEIYPISLLLIKQLERMEWSGIIFVRESTSLNPPLDTLEQRSSCDCLSLVSNTALEPWECNKGVWTLIGDTIPVFIFEPYAAQLLDNVKSLLSLAFKDNSGSLCPLYCLGTSALLFAPLLIFFLQGPIKITTTTVRQSL